jgi:hypothetical protein
MVFILLIGALRQGRCPVSESEILQVGGFSPDMLYHKHLSGLKPPTYTLPYKTERIKTVPAPGA